MILMAIKQVRIFPTWEPERFGDRSYSLTNQLRDTERALRVDGFQVKDGEIQGYVVAFCVTEAEGRRYGLTYFGDGLGGGNLNINDNDFFLSLDGGLKSCIGDDGINNHVITSPDFYERIARGIGENAAVAERGKIQGGIFIVGNPGYWGRHERALKLRLDSPSILMGSVGDLTGLGVENVGAVVVDVSEVSRADSPVVGFLRGYAGRKQALPVLTTRYYAPRLPGAFSGLSEGVHYLGLLEKLYPIANRPLESIFDDNLVLSLREAWAQKQS